MSKCVHCGAELNEDGTKHYNGIVFCAFVGPGIDWGNPHAARRTPEPEEN